MAKMPNTIDFDVRVHGVPAGYKLVPIEAPESVCGLITGYGSDLSYMTERDRKVIVERGRDYWRDLLSAIPEPAIRVSMVATYGALALQGASEQRPPCTVCGKSHAEHGSYPTCATHPYTPDGTCQHVVGAACVGAECRNGCVRGRGNVGVNGPLEGRKP